jgi:ParB/RepB/Spo0J family partition protein
MSQVDQLQNAEEHVAQQREDAARAERRAAEEDLRREPLATTAAKAHAVVQAPLAQVRTMVNMRVGRLPDVHDLAVSIKETGLLHPPLVRATDDPDKPYELLAGRRRFAAMQLLDAAEGARGDWRFTLVQDISRREALTMQFAENFHQHKPEPVQFARAARAILAEDPSLTAADLSRLVGAPAAWTRKALALLDLPEGVLERVAGGDLSITVADLVRRGIARGDVTAQEAEDLVEQRVEGRITGGALKLGVGYVPPKPKDYEEQSRRLDEARWAAKDRAEADDADQRDWEADGAEVRVSRGGGAGAAGGGRSGGDPARAGGAGGPGGGAAGEEAALADLTSADLDGYLLGVVLERLAGPAHRSALGLREDDDPAAYAAALPAGERLRALRQVAAALLAEERRPGWG